MVAPAPAADVAEPALRWALDHCVVSEHGVFAHGWCAHPGQRVTQVWLEWSGPDGQRHEARARYGENRADVAQAYPQLTPACAFLVYATTPTAQHGSAWRLRIELDDGTVCVHALQPPQATPAGRAPGAWAAWRGRLGRAWQHLRRGHWRLLVARARSVAADLRAQDRRAQGVQAELAGLAPGTTLVVDHAMGGGANLYRQGLVAGEHAAGRDVLVWSFVPSAMRFSLSLQPARGTAQRWWVDAQAWDSLVACGRVARVVFNNSTSFPDPLRWPANLLRLQQAGARLCFLVHDFFAVCPSHFLLDHRERHCGIPDRTVCRACLPRIQDPLLSIYPARDIDAWRAHWGACLAASDEIVCFSGNTRDLLLRAYPALDEARIQVRPHDVSHIQGRHQPPAQAQPLRIGVIGKIDHHKGAAVVDDLLREIEARDAPVEVHVIGVYGGAVRSPRLRETGPYERKDLARLINEHGVHLALMPSIYPETFSYVAHELVALRVPLLTLDLGAQADAARQYALGRVAPTADAPQLLDEILRFGRHLHADAGTLAA